MFVESGEFLWNTGLMLWRTSTLLHLLKTNGVLMGNWLDTDWQGLTPEQELKKIEENYPSSLHTSIDLVVLGDLPETTGASICGLDNYLVAFKGNQLVICPNDDPGRVRKMVNEAQIQYGDDFV